MSTPNSIRISKSVASLILTQFVQVSTMITDDCISSTDYFMCLSSERALLTFITCITMLTQSSTVFLQEILHNEYMQVFWNSTLLFKRSDDPLTWMVGSERECAANSHDSCLNRKTLSRDSLTCLLSPSARPCSCFCFCLYLWSSPVPCTSYLCPSFLVP